jgi:hypothetical protein
MSDLLLNLKTTLDNLGRTVRTRAPESQDPMDKATHEYNIAGYIRNYGEKRYELAKDALLRHLNPATMLKIEEKKQSVKKTGVSANMELVDTQFFRVMGEVKIGASYLDIDGLKADLEGKLGMQDTAALIIKHTKRRAPNLTVKVTEVPG